MLNIWFFIYGHMTWNTDKSVVSVVRCLEEVDKNFKNKMEPKCLAVQLPRNNSLGEIGVARSLSARALGSSPESHHSPPLRFPPSPQLTWPQLEMGILLQESQQRQSLPEEMLLRAAGLQDSPAGSVSNTEKTIHVWYSNEKQSEPYFHQSLGH